MSLEKFRENLPRGAFWITGDLLRSLLDLILEDRARLMPSSGDEIPSPQGRWFNTRGGTGDGTGATTHPFLVIDASTTGPDVAKVRIYSGTINAMDQVANGPFSAGDDPVLTKTVTNGQHVYVDITLSYNSTTGVWSYTSFTITAGALPSATPTHAYYSLGTVVVASNAVTSIGGGVSGNIGHERCGDSTTYVDHWGAGP